MKQTSPEHTDSDASLPLVPVDPRDVGPQQLLSRWWSWVRDLLDRHSREILLTAVVSVGIMLWFDLQIPRVPDWLLVGIGGVVVMTPSALVLGYLTGMGVYRPDSILVKELDAPSGDTRLLRVSPERWGELAVVSPNGKRRGTEFLERISVNGTPAYEVDRMDLRNDLLVVSSMAGRTNTEIRRDREEIDRVKTELEREADKSLTMMVSAGPIMRKLGKKLANHMIRVVERVENPTGEEIHDELMDVVEEENPAEDLLDDDLGVDTSDESDESGSQSGPSDPSGPTASSDDSTGVEVSTEVSGDVFERAASMGGDSDD